MNPGFLMTRWRALAAAAMVLLTLGQVAPAVAAREPQSLRLSLGESQVIKLDKPVKRVAVGHPGIADFILLGPQELYVLGKAPGSTNLVMWDASGHARHLRAQVVMNLSSLRQLIARVLPAEKDIQLLSSGDSVILTGTVADVTTAETVQRLAATQLDSARASYTRDSKGGKQSASRDAGAANAAGADRGSSRIVNLLRIRSPQQVMLEVRVAEVSKSYLESLGIEWGQTGGLSGGSLMTGFVNNTTLSLLLGRGVAQKVDSDGSPLYSNRQTNVGVEAERKDGWVKILAEPTIVAISGQEGSFLVGGKIFIPVNQALGSTTYEERTYGVGLRFLPTVLESGRINLRVAPEISEPVKESVTAGTKDSLPAFKSSFVSTTVQMNAGENLVIGGLLRDNINQIVKAVPVLGEVPVFGALFRSTQYITERTELLIVVRPTLVSARAEAPMLPTENFNPPTRSEFFMGGRMQGEPRPRPAP